MLGHLTWASLASYTESTGWPISLSLSLSQIWQQTEREREKAKEAKISTALKALS